MVKNGNNLDAKTRSGMVALTAKDGIDSKKQHITTFTFHEGDFIDDYSQMIVPQNPERFTKYFSLTWGAHDYFCSSFNEM